jgi:phosphotransferase system IIA component
MRWTEDEIRILLMHISVNSSNLQKAFYDASLQNGHSVRSNEQLWYCNIKPKWEEMKRTNPSLQPYFIKIEKNSVHQPNIKNTPRSRTELNAIRHALNTLGPRIRH